MGCGPSKPQQTSHVDVGSTNTDSITIFQYEKEAPGEAGEGSKPPPNFNKRRKRQSVSAECFSPGDAHVTNPKFPKTPEEEGSIKARLCKNVLFNALDDEQTRTIVLALKRVNFPVGSEIISQGSTKAENFYIVEAGTCEAAGAAGCDEGQDAGLDAGWHAAVLLGEVGGGDGRLGEVGGGGGRTSRTTAVGSDRSELS